MELWSCTKPTMSRLIAARPVLIGNFEFLRRRYATVIRFSFSSLTTLFSSCNVICFVAILSSVLD